MCRPEPINTDTVILAIKHMKNTNSRGHDGIPLRFLIDSFPVIIAYLSCIFDTSFVTEIFPSVWKHSVVIPIHKSGNTNVPSNYRPISLLPKLSKVLEKIISSQLSDHLERNQLLSHTQHAFRRNLPNDTALLTLRQIILKHGYGAGLPNYPL